MFEYHLYRKPALGTRLQRGHPLVNGLVFCAPFNEGGGAPFDLISGKQATLTGASSWQRGGFYSSATSGIYADFGTLPLVPDGGLMTVALGLVVDNSTNSTGPFQSGGQMVRVLSSNRLSFELDYDTTDLASRFAHLALGEVGQAALTHDGSKTLSGVLRYRDAFVRATTTTTAPAGTYQAAASTLKLGQFAGVLLYCYVYNRVLTSAEIAQLHTDPYALFQRSARGRLIVPGAALQTISPSGIASEEAFGTPVVSPGAVTLSPTGIVSAEAFGTPVVSPGGVIVSPGGIASEEAFGTPTLSPGAVTVSPTGIESAEAFGTPTVVTDAEELPAILDWALYPDPFPATDDAGSSPVAGEWYTLDVAWGQGPAGATGVLSTTLSCAGATIDTGWTGATMGHRLDLGTREPVEMGFSPNGKNVYLSPREAAVSYWRVKFPSAGSYSLVLAGIGSMAVTATGAPVVTTPTVTIVHGRPLGYAPAKWLRVAFDGTYPSGGLDLPKRLTALSGAYAAFLLPTEDYGFSWDAVTGKLKMFPIGSAAEVSGAVDFTTEGLFLGLA